MGAPQGLEGRFYFFERDIYSLSEAKKLCDEQGYAEATFTARSLNYGEGTGWEPTSFSDFLGNDIDSLSTWAPNQNLDHFMVSLTGYVYLDAGTYNFSAYTDDGFELKIGGQVITSFEDLRAPGRSEGQGSFESGLYEIEITYFDNRGGSLLQIDAQKDGTTENIFDGNAFYKVPEQYFGDENLEEKTDEQGRSYLTKAPDTIPVLAADTATVNEDGSVIIDVLSNDYDADGDQLYLSYAYQAEHGEVTTNDDGTITYRPDADFNGQDTFLYKVVDEDGNFVRQSVTVNVNPINDAPELSAEISVDELAEGQNLEINLASYFSDRDNDQLSFTVTGASFANIEGNILRLAPVTGHEGDYTITIQARDPSGEIAETNVSFHVTPQTAEDTVPVLIPDHAEVIEDTSVIIDPLANDNDADGDTLSLIQVFPAENGTVSINPDGTVTYTPDDNFNGVDTFRYQVQDEDGNILEQDVSLTVTPVNDAPVLTDTIHVPNLEAGNDILIDLSSSFTDPDGDILTFNVEGADFASIEGSNLRLSPAQGQEGQHDIVITATDNSGAHITTSVEFDVTEDPVDPDPDPDLAEGLQHPSVAMNLSAVRDWGSNLPFLDLMKQAREWVVTEEGSWWGGIDMQEVRDAGLEDTHGWITEMPDGAWRLTSIVMDVKASEHNPEVTAGEYTLRYEGEGEINLQGHGLTVLSRQDGEITFELSGDQHSITVHVDGTDPNQTGDYIKNISVVKSDYLELYETGEIFNPQWLDLVEDFRVLRFMEWMNTNGSVVKELSDQPQVDDLAWNRDAGVPLEVMVELANQTGTDPWFTIPFHATDEYIREFAAYVKENLDPSLKAYVEYSNEVWNYGYGFSQTEDANVLGRELFGTTFGDHPHREYYGYRSAQVQDIFRDAFGDTADEQLISVLATQTRNDDWPLYTAVRGAEVYAESVGKSVSELFDEVSTTWYFGGGFGSPAAHGGFAEQVIDWISTFGEARAKDMIFEQLSGTAQHVDMTGQPDWASPPTIETALDYIRVQAEFAQQYGWTVNSYEGGSHMVGTTLDVMDALSEFFQELHVDPRMGDLYAQVYEGWLDIEGTTLFNQFQEVGVHSNWGSFSALQDLLDNSPRWDALKEFNEEAPDWAQRAEGTFDHGVRIFGTEAAETLTGTVEEDFLIAGDGNDILLGGAGNDGLHGGDGDDILISGDGSDTVLGGSGADRFTFNALDQGQDVIRDFNLAEGDILDISDLLTLDNDDNIILENYIRLDEVEGDTVLMINSTGNQGTEYQTVARLEGITELGSIDDLVQNEVILITD
ncbi:hypothetical protein WH95_03375 [Kiloniella litopenaei]|uniref:Dystroglycan-type cadherin-like domain-containing protein n=1 Tax=Kiloniella litopenaei TaxID=1549748 RepID=A0A0M2REA8_9PROT|nr:Ig-like domain-containing protein [Kiloniella litopenaei]KKJ78350.1 hypothetical protein WH95_03375 [Kiloniella litopenaei]